MADLLYRDHRGGLSESMQTVKTVDTIEDVKVHLNETLKGFGGEVESIDFKHMGLDERIGRDTYNVLATLKGDTKPFVAGMTNGMPS